MFESADGVIVTATRQNAGRLGIPGGPVGGVNVPAGTDCAIVTLANGIATEARLSHVVAASTAAEPADIATKLA
jgi:hypothetical protein